MTARIAGPESQATFDVIMRTLSEPGTVRRLPASLESRSVPAIGWLGLALADVGVNVAANRAAILNSQPPLTDSIAEATGATITDLDDGWIVLLDQPTVADIARLERGSASTPESGARVAIAADELSSSHIAGSVTISLAGPGIPTHRTLSIRGVSHDVLASLGRSTGDFPAGIDAWLFTPDGHVAAIPRSTVVSTIQEQN